MTFSLLSLLCSNGASGALAHPCSSPAAAPPQHRPNFCSSCPELELEPSHHSHTARPAPLAHLSPGSCLSSVSGKLLMSQVSPFGLLIPPIRWGVGTRQDIGSVSTHTTQPWEPCSNTVFLCQTFPNSVLTPPHPPPGFIHQPVPGVLIAAKGSPRPGGLLCEFLSHDSQILSRAGLASSGQTGSCT